MIYFTSIIYPVTLLYAIGIHFFYLIVLAASPFYPKARLWIKGRLGWRGRLKQWKDLNPSVIWIHAASLGEFEQGRPIIDEINRTGRYKILLSFYSPSGFEIRKNFPGADYVMYLPLDTWYNANRFVSLVKPVKTIFIKYEFWYFFLRQLNQFNYPVYLVSSIFRPDQIFFKSYGFWFRKKLRFIDYFFLQDENSVRLLNRIGLENCRISGDTRFDRVKTIAEQAVHIDIAARFSDGHFCIVAGSTWPEDEDFLACYIRGNLQGVKWIIAPHEIGEEHITRLVGIFKQLCVRFSDATPENIGSRTVLLVDNIGMLSSLYQYGRLAYIGGGFGKGIHNILEAAAFGIPVIFGPNHLRFREAVDLVRLGGAYSVSDYDQLQSILNSLISGNTRYQSSAGICAGYVRENAGATKRILDHLFNNI